MKLTVGTQPQGVFTQGDQSDVTITNDGPFTVYLDENSAISSDQSLPLPPLASVPWKARTPLWALANGASSVVRIARTNAAPATPGDGKQRVIYNDSEAMPLTTTGLIETGSYQSLFLRWSKPNGSAISLVKLSWYSSDGKFLKRERYSPGLVNLSPTYYYRATVPVNGAFVTISGFIEQLASLLVIGSTSQLETSLYPDFDGNSQEAPIELTNNVSTLSYASNYAQFTWDLSLVNSVKLHQLGNRLAFNLHFSALPSETGTIELRDSISGQSIGELVSIVTTAANYYHEWLVPRAAGYTLVCTNVVALPLNPIATLTWVE